MVNFLKQSEYRKSVSELSYELDKKESVLKEYCHKKHIAFSNLSAGVSDEILTKGK